MTRSFLIGCAAFALCSSAALADNAPTDEQLPQIEASLKAWGCAGGAPVVEDGSGFIEVEDAKCSDGKVYDIKLKPDYALHSITEG